MMLWRLTALTWFVTWWGQFGRAIWRDFFCKDLLSSTNESGFWGRRYINISPKMKGLAMAGNEDCKGWLKMIAWFLLVFSCAAAWICKFYFFYHWGRDGTSYEHGVAQGQGRCSLADTKSNFRIFGIDDFGRLFFVLLVLVYTRCESSRFPPLNQMNVKVVVVVVVVVVVFVVVLVVPPFAQVDEVAACIMFATISACEILWQILRNSIAVENFQRFWSKTFQMLQSYLVGKLGHRKSGWRGFTIPPPPKKKNIRTTTWPF